MSRHVATGKRQKSGFTLIEVMISIFLALLLIVGINGAFKVVSTTVGAGQAMATATRDSFSSQLSFQQELGHTISHDNDTPFLIIDSQVQKAFLNRQDMNADKDGNVLTIDLDNNNQEGEATVPGEQVPWSRQTSRTHRIDTLGFFSTDLYRRQTGNDWDPTYVPPGVTDPTNPTDSYVAAEGAYAAAQSSRQAYVWFGHLWLPGSAKGPLSSPPDERSWYIDNKMPSYPGEGDATTNPNNFLASDWILGRMAILLTEGYKRPDRSLDTPMSFGAINSQSDDWQKAETTPPNNPDRPAPAPVDQDTGGGTRPYGKLLTAIDRPAFIAPPDPTAGTGGSKKDDPSTSYLPIARYHRPGADGTGRIFLYPDFQNGTAVQVSYDPRFPSPEDGRYDIAVGSFRIFKSILRQATDNTDYWNGAAGVANTFNFRWWESLCYRFKGDPRVTSPMDPTGIARSQQVFLRHCTQFIVEYAGDFVKQDNDVYLRTNFSTQYKVNPNHGNVTDVYYNAANPGTATTDNLIDYYVDKSLDKPATPDQANPQLWTRRVRWYGFPRDTNGDGKILGYREVRKGEGAVLNNDIVDVVPLRDIMLTGYTKDLSTTPVAWGGPGKPAPVLPTKANASLMVPAVTFAGAPFEKDLEPFDNNDNLHPGWLPSPGRIRFGGTPSGDYAQSVSGQSRYICAFGPIQSLQNQSGGGARVHGINAGSDAPYEPMVADDGLARIRMIRVTVTLDDANSRLAEGQTFQYIIGMP